MADLCRYSTIPSITNVENNSRMAWSLSHLVVQRIPHSNAPFLQQSIEPLIFEINQPVVERSVLTIACIMRKEIVTKDVILPWHGMEGGETKMRKAAQLMVANLAGSLGLVTCRIVS